MQRDLLIVTSIILFLLTTTPLHAETEIIPFNGYRASGDFQDINTGITLDVDDEISYGFAINIDSGPDTQYEFLYSDQSSKLRAGATLPTNVLFDIDIEYIHIGGIKLYPIDALTQSYLGAGLGVTRFNPDVAGFKTESKFSINISGGIKKQISEHVGFRFGLSFYGTPVNSNSAIFCGSSNGCTVRFKSDFFTQYEASAGLILKF